MLCRYRLAIRLYAGAVDFFAATFFRLTNTPRGYIIYVAKRQNNNYGLLSVNKAVAS